MKGMPFSGKDCALKQRRLSGKCFGGVLKSAYLEFPKTSQSCISETDIMFYWLLSFVWQLAFSVHQNFHAFFFLQVEEKL